MRAEVEPVGLDPSWNLRRVAVVIPAWNEAEAIGPVVAEVLREGVGEVIVADGGSKDGTADAARAAGARVLDAGRGYGRACAAGAAAARPECDVLAYMDGDGADCADQLPRLAGPVLEGAQDFVIASRTRGVRAPGSMNWHQVLAGAVAGRLMGRCTACATPTCAPSGSYGGMPWRGWGWRR